HARLGIRVLEIVDELLDVLDRVDVVVRGRRDELHARRREAHLRDPRVDLPAGQLAALAGLGALGHLDLQVGRVDQVLAGPPEAARGALLDGAPPPVPVGVGRVAGRVLAALARVRAPADTVHGDREGLVAPRAA